MPDVDVMSLLARLADAMHLPVPWCRLSRLPLAFVHCCGAIVCFACLCSCPGSLSERL